MFGANSPSKAPSNPSDKVKVIFHYQRGDNQYAGWNIWIWKAGQSGKSVNFEGKGSGGRTVTLEIDKNWGELNFLIRKNNWQEKDIEVDRKISLNRADREGNLDVYLRQNDPLVYYEPPRVKIYETYQGDDLGVRFITGVIQMCVWSPMAHQVELMLYEKGEGGALPRVFAMKQHQGGTWKIQMPRTAEKCYYTYRIDGKEAVDPYAVAVGVNGDRGQIIDLTKTNPKGWEQDTRPFIKNPEDAIIYELHVRNYTIGENSGVSQNKKGKYLGLVETGTKTPQGLASGLAHLKELGVTHVQIMPVFDFATVDEKKRTEITGDMILKTGILPKAAMRPIPLTGITGSKNLRKW